MPISSGWKMPWQVSFPSSSIAGNLVGSAFEIGTHIAKKAIDNYYASQNKKTDNGKGRRQTFKHTSKYHRSRYSRNTRYDSRKNKRRRPNKFRNYYRT